MKELINRLEKYSFGVSAYLAEKMNMSVSKVRMFFIYSTFLAAGFPVIVYLLAAFVLDIRKFVKVKSRNFLREM